MLDDDTLKWANVTPRYHVTPMYGVDGNLAAHYNDALAEHGLSFGHLMETDEHFASIIAIDLAAERRADDSLSPLAELAPDEKTHEMFLYWLALINGDLSPWTTGGAIHFRSHWARVLVHALALGRAHDLPECDLEALAMAAVFHDSRRADPYLDTGHGARGACYYAQFSMADSTEKGARNTPAARDIGFDPRTYLAISLHDRDDEYGIATIESCLADDAIPELDLSGVRERIPVGARASAELIYRIFKDADALDRVRLGRGGLDPRYLRTDPAREAIPFAEQLLAKCSHA